MNYDLSPFLSTHVAAVVTFATVGLTALATAGTAKSAFVNAAISVAGTVSSLGSAVFGQRLFGQRAPAQVIHIPNIQQIQAVPQPVPVATAPSTYANALIARDMLFERISTGVTNPQVWAVDNDPLPVLNHHTDNQPNFRLRGSPFYRMNMPLMTNADKLREILRIYREARRVGTQKRNRSNFVRAEAYRDAIARVHKLIDLLHPGNLRWANRLNGYQGQVMPQYEVATRRHTLARVNPTTAKLDDSYYESSGVRFDVKWAADLFVLVMWFASQFGATDHQARYIAISATINAMFTCYGIDPTEIVPEGDPGDFGVVAPPTVRLF